MQERAKRILKLGILLLAGIFMVTALTGSYTAASAASKAEAQSIIDKAKGAVTDMASDETFSWLHQYLKNAKGVLIFPQVLKAGFFLGGSGGTGVLLVNNGGNNWSEPAFYTLGSVTFGLQIGGEAAEVVMLAMNQKALDSLLSSSVKLGGDVSVAIGPIGGGAKGAMTVPEVTADFVSFTKTKGLYAGLNLEGSVLEVRDGLNGAYYGKYTLPKDIIVRKDVGNPGANGLRAALEKASAR
ncbi:MAG TPA: lipid-binding SYLF domain-containing protein [Geobacteraceae bacterium]